MRGAQSQRQRAEFSDTQGAAPEHCRVRRGPAEPTGPSHWQARVPPPRALLRAVDIPTERARHPWTLPRGPFPLLPYRGLQPLNCYVVNRLLPSVPAEDWGLFCILSCRILNVQDPAGSQSFRINPSSAVLASSVPPRPPCATAPRQPRSTPPGTC